MIDGVEDDEAAVVVVTEDGEEHRIVTMTNRATMSFQVPYQELLDHLAEKYGSPVVTIHVNGSQSWPRVPATW